MKTLKETVVTLKNLPTKNHKETGRKEEKECDVRHITTESIQAQ